MELKVILCCDDNKEFLDRFRKDHEGSFIVRTANTIKELYEKIQEDERLPDLVLLDIFFVREADSRIKQKEKAAEEALVGLDNQIEKTKKAAFKAWEPAGLEALEDLRRRYPADKLNIAMYTRKGRCLLADSQLDTVDEDDAVWLIKKNRPLGSEGAIIERIIKRLNKRYSESYHPKSYHLTSLFAGVIVSFVIGFVLARFVDVLKLRTALVIGVGLIASSVFSYYLSKALDRLHKTT